MIAPRTADQYRAEAAQHDRAAVAHDDRARDATTLADRTAAQLDADRSRRRALDARRAAETLALRAIGGAA